MRFAFAVLLCLFVGSPATGQTTVMVEVDTSDAAGKRAVAIADSQRAAKNAVRIAADSTGADSVIANRAKLVTSGITVLRGQDAGWVTLDFPVSGATGWKKAALKLAHRVALDLYGGKPSGVAYRCRMPTGKATTFLKWMDAAVI